jgi:pimeloyl-ACP methyl ester carboxylesterase
VGQKLEQSLAILNGVLGDHLARTDNGLAITLSFVHEGAPLSMSRSAFARALPKARPKIVVLVHGLMCTEQIWKMRDGSDYGSLLERDFAVTPLYVRYNSGRAIVENGAALANLLEDLGNAYPETIDEMLLIGFSMGGLIIRSACHVAKQKRHAWLSRVKCAIYIGTPHRGSPIERAGRLLVRTLRIVPDPYTRLLADIGDLRSLGLQNLGDRDLEHEDAALPRTAGTPLCDQRHPVPLLPEIQHYLIAGALAKGPWLALWFGDALVPLSSATADACGDVKTVILPPERVKIFHAFAHMRLAHDPAVYAQIRAWLEAHGE